MATGFRKNKENKKKVVAKVVDFLDFDNQYLGNRKSDSNDFFSSRICGLRTTSKNPCYAQATWDWICLKKAKQTNKLRIKGPT